tara:strand:+ start:9719 stop:10147 length:429 start_codon:yes stop_codon:yes gene_type:complete
MVRKRRAKIKWLLFVFLLALLVWSSYYFGGFDRLGLRQNTVLIKCDFCSKYDDVSVFFISQDTLKLQPLSKERFYTSDWYAKDHILLQLQGKSIVVGFDEFKFDSWKKVNAILNLSMDENNQWYLNYQLNTIWTQKSDSVAF